MRLFVALHTRGKGGLQTREQAGHKVCTCLSSSVRVFVFVVMVYLWRCDLFLPSRRLPRGLYLWYHSWQKNITTKIDSVDDRREKRPFAGVGAD